MKWFKHDTDSLRNRKIRKVIRTHGVTGYAIWFALLEKIYEAEGDFQILADELWLEDLAEDLKISDYRVLIRVLDTFADVGLISSQLWQGEHLIFCEAIAERGDAYIDKRAKEAEKKRRQRNTKKEESLTMSPGDKVGTAGQNHEMSPADLDPDLEFRSRDQNLDLDHTHNPDLRVRDFEQSLPEPEPTVVSPAAYVSPPVTVTRKEIQFTADPMGDRFSAGSDLPEWRTGRGVNGLKPEFVEWLCKSYLAKLPCYKESAPSAADAKSWIVKRERYQSDEIEIQWQAFQDRGAQTVAKTSAAYDWSRDSRLSEWTALANSMNNYRFCYPDGVRDEERVAFYQWLEKQEVRSA